MNITRLKILARRAALECLVRYNDKMTTQDIAYALNVGTLTVRRDTTASDVIWQQDNYLYYGERL